MPQIEQRAQVGGAYFGSEQVDSSLQLESRSHIRFRFGDIIEKPVKFNVCRLNAESQSEMKSYNRYAVLIDVEEVQI